MDRKAVVILPNLLEKKQPANFIFSCFRVYHVFLRGSKMSRGNLEKIQM